MRGIGRRSIFGERTPRVELSVQTPEFIVVNAEDLSAELKYFTLLAMRHAAGEDVGDEYTNSLNYISNCSPLDLAYEIVASRIIDVLEVGAPSDASVAEIVTLFKSIVKYANEMSQSTQEIGSSKVPRGLRTAIGAAVIAATLSSALPAAAADNANNSAASLSSTTIFNGSATQTSSTPTPTSATTTQPYLEQSPPQQADEVMVFGGAAEAQASQDVQQALPASENSNPMQQATEVTGLMRVFEQTSQGEIEVMGKVDAASNDATHGNKQEIASSIAELLGIQSLDVFSIPNPEDASTHGTKIKAMSYNVLGERAARIFKNGGNISWRDRLDAAVSVIKQSNPDVIGFQEVDDIQYVQLNKALSDEYDTFPAKRGPGSNRMISWRVSEYDLVESGMYGVERYKEKRAQFPWVKLRSIETGEEFLMTNVHTTAGAANNRRNFSRSGLSPSEQRAEQAEKLLLVLDKVNTEKLPVMIVGDYNSSCEKTGSDQGVPQEKIPCRMLYSAGYQDAALVANEEGEAVNYNTSTAHGKAGAARKHKARHIDHIMVSEGIEIRGWKNIINELSRIASDHTPVEAELTIGSTDLVDEN